MKRTILRIIGIEKGKESQLENPEDNKIIEENFLNSKKGMLI